MLAKANLKDPDFLKARACAMVAPACAYYVETLLPVRSSMVQRMDAASAVFDCLRVKGNPLTKAQVEALSIFKFSKHPSLAPHLRGMVASQPSCVSASEACVPACLRACLPEPSAPHCNMSYLFG